MPSTPTAPPADAPAPPAVALTAAHRDYADEVYQRTLQVIGAVHDPDPHDATPQATTARLIDEILTLPAPPGVQPEHAFGTILAAQVNYDSTAADRLGWYLHAHAPGEPDDHYATLYVEFAVTPDGREDAKGVATRLAALLNLTGAAVTLTQP